MENNEVQVFKLIMFHNIAELFILFWNENLEVANVNIFQNFMTELLLDSCSEIYLSSSSSIFSGLKIDFLVWKHV